MLGEPHHPLPTTANRAHGGAANGSDERPGLRPPMAGSPCMVGAAKTALIQLIDGQIGARRAEIDELMRLRGIVLKDGRMSTG